jgi:hypothetical protein
LPNTLSMPFRLSPAGVIGQAAANAHRAEHYSHGRSPGALTQISNPPKFTRPWRRGGHGNEKWAVFVETLAKKRIVRIRWPNMVRSGPAAPTLSTTIDDMQCVRHCGREK